MILGIGTDMCDVTRIEKTWQRFGTRFENRLLHANDWRPEKLNANFLAKRFAAKEAVAKALGTAIRGDVTLKDIRLHKASSGKPQVVLSRRVAATLPKGYRLHISLSDERNFAMAFAILEAAD